jgi:hypothetical protein
MPMWSIGLRERSEGGVGRRAMDAPRPVAPSRPRPPAAAAEKPWPDPRRLTPRQMVDLGHRLYIAGQLGFDDSRLLSCQPELHPDYATTVARLTGRRPAPDVPHDHVEDWERRLAFALRYTPDDDERIGRIQRIVSALTRLAATASPPPYRTRE